MLENGLVGEEVVPLLLDYQELTAWCGNFDPFEAEGEFSEPPAPCRAPQPGTIGIVIAHYQQDPLSTFHKLRWSVREGHRTLLRRIDAQYGHWKFERIDTRELLEWYTDWSSGGRLASGHAFVAQMRTLLTHGILFLPNGLERTESARVRGLLKELKFPSPPPRVETLTADHAMAIREVAHKHFGWHSIALAQALQFELMLRQKDVIGEWVPDTEPGESSLTIYGEKWLRGLRWNEIDHNLILRHVTSKRQKAIQVDLKLAPMVMEELERGVTSRIIPGGPVIICEITGLPYRGNEFRRKWRLVANQAGIPKNVRNMDSRAGGITEAFAAGVGSDMVRQMATHSDVSMTQRYNRGNHLETFTAGQSKRLERRALTKGEA